MIDWRDPARRDEIRIQMVDPNNLDNIYGDMTDVQLSETSIVYGYYTDTRYAASIQFLKPNNYVENAWIRIIHDVPKEGYSNELGTFIPTSPSESRTGAVVVSMSLESPLWGIKEDLLTAKFSIGAKTSLLSAIQRVCNNCNRPYLLENPNDVKSNKAIVYDVGESYLKILLDLCEQTNNRVEVDGHGRFVIVPLPDYASLTPTWYLDNLDPRSMIIENSIKMETEVGTLPSRAIVVNGNAIGFADLPDGISYSSFQRGYVKAEMIEDKTATTKASAESVARNKLNTTHKSVVWSMECLYFPCKCGDNVTFVLDGEKHICMIQSIDPLRLDTMTMGISLREVYYNE